jgi:hypothetical protein
MHGQGQAVALNGVAVAAVVCGASAFPCVAAGLTWGGGPLRALALLLSVAAVGLGFLGRERLFRSEPAPHGNWMACVGVVLGATILTGAGLVMPGSVSGGSPSPAPVVQSVPAGG